MMILVPTNKQDLEKMESPIPQQSDTHSKTIQVGLETCQVGENSPSVSTIQIHNVPKNQ